jgi:hypothetical protein
MLVFELSNYRINKLKTLHEKLHLPVALSAFLVSREFSLMARPLCGFCGHLPELRAIP